MTSLSKRTGCNVRKARREAGLTQEQLATKAKVASATISRLERGLTEYPRADEFVRIAAALGKTTDELRGLAGEVQARPPETSAAELSAADEDGAILRAFRGNLAGVAQFLIQTEHLPEHDRRFVLEAIEWAQQRIEAARDWEDARRAQVNAELIALHPRERNHANA